jgi:hypothetical protein
LTNPFVIGQWVKGNKFYGRAQQIADVLTGPRNAIWLLGTRRIGKTSLLKQIEYLAWHSSERKWFPVFWDFQGADSLEELNAGFNEALLDAEEQFAELGLKFEDLEGDDLFRSLRTLRRRLRGTGLQLLLLCDEVEELIKLHQTERTLLRKLRRAMQAQEDCRSVLASTIKLWKLVDERTDTSPFLHGFTPPMYISRLTDEEACALIVQKHLPEEARPVIDPDVVEDVRRKCDNHPYLIQLVCKRYLEEGDFQAAIEQVSVDQMVSYFFAIDVEMLSDTERDVLRVIADSSASSSGSLVEKVGLDTAQLSGVLLRLEQLGYVRRNAGGQFELVNFFFHKWFCEGMGAGVGGRARSSDGSDANQAVSEPRLGDMSTQMPELAGAVLDGRYRLTRELGKGATGTVYEAQDTVLGETIAIKLLNQEFCANPGMLERFRREVLASRDLGHRNILKVYHLGKSGEDWYMAMKLVTGGTLSHVLEMRKELEIPLALRIGKCLASALEAAHTQNIIHRDIKPSNILMGEGDEPYLADFGLARLMLEPGLTQAGVFLGTPDYASPEQARLLPPDERSDLYSLGVVLFEMITGRRPFVSESVQEVLQMHREQVPPDPSSLREDIPLSVSTVILRCLEKDAGQRYESAARLQMALEAVF